MMLRRFVGDGWDGFGIVELWRDGCGGNGDDGADALSRLLEAR